MAGSNQWVMDESNHFAAYLHNDEGRDVAVLNRCGRAYRSGSVETYVGSPVGEPETHATTDEQWQSIVDCIAAAPEMVEVLKSALITEFNDREEVREFCEAVRAVLAKAEPPRKVKKRMLVTVEVEVEGDADAPTDVFKSHALDFVYTGGGVGTRFMGKKVTTLGELYED